MIDRDSPIPVYYQIQQDILERIRKHEWFVNEQMPSESQLVKEYGVSRVTLRQALGELEKDNIIKRYRGKGAFITGFTPKPFVHDLNYKLVKIDKGFGHSDDITATIIELKTVHPVYENIRADLHLEENDEAIYLKRLFLLNGKPIAIGKSWLPANLLPGFVEQGLIDNSLSRTLEERYGYKTDQADDYFEAIRSTQSESNIFNCPLDVPLLLIAGHTFMKDGTPLESSQTVWLGDAVRFHLHFHDSGDGLVIG